MGISQHLFCLGTFLLSIILTIYRCQVDAQCVYNTTHCQCTQAEENSVCLRYQSGHGESAICIADKCDDPGYRCDCTGSYLCPLTKCKPQWQPVGPGPLVIGDVYHCEKHVLAAVSTTSGQGSNAQEGEITETLCVGDPETDKLQLPTPSPFGHLCNQAAGVCCSEKCYICGAPGCEKSTARLFKRSMAKNCCRKEILESGKICGVHSVPCILPNTTDSKDASLSESSEPASSGDSPTPSASPIGFDDGDNDEDSQDAFGDIANVSRLFANSTSSPLSSSPLLSPSVSGNLSVSSDPSTPSSTHNSSSSSASSQSATPSVSYSTSPSATPSPSNSPNASVLASPSISPSSSISSNITNSDSDSSSLSTSQNLPLNGSSTSTVIVSSSPSVTPAPSEILSLAPSVSQISSSSATTSPSASSSPTPITTQSSTPSVSMTSSPSRSPTPSPAESKSAPENNTIPSKMDSKSNTPTASLSSNSDRDTHSSSKSTNFPFPKGFIGSNCNLEHGVCCDQDCSGCSYDQCWNDENGNFDLNIAMKCCSYYIYPQKRDCTKDAPPCVLPGFTAIAKTSNIDIKSSSFEEQTGTDITETPTPSKTPVPPASPSPVSSPSVSVAVFTEDTENEYVLCNEQKGVCCDKSCKICGELGCGNDDSGRFDLTIANECCAEYINAQGRMCGENYIEELPCILNKTEFEYDQSTKITAFGKLCNEGLGICCDETCAKCGGLHCGNDASGTFREEIGEKCCSGYIKKRSPPCDEAPPPCSLPNY